MCKTWNTDRYGCNSVQSTCRCNIRYVTPTLNCKTWSQPWLILSCLSDSSYTKLQYEYDSHPLQYIVLYSGFAWYFDPPQEGQWIEQLESARNISRIGSRWLIWTFTRIQNGAVLFCLALDQFGVSIKAPTRQLHSIKHGWAKQQDNAVIFAPVLL